MIEVLGASLWVLQVFIIIFIHKVIRDGYGTSYEIGKIIIENSKHQSIIKIHGGDNMNYR